MLLRIYDFLTPEKPKFADNFKGVVSEVISLKYTRRAYDVGSFELTVPAGADNVEKLQPDRLILFGDDILQRNIVGETLSSLSSDALYITEIPDKNEDTITVTGYDLKYFLAQRLTLFPTEEQDKGTYGYYVAKGTTFQCLSQLIRYNVTECTDPDRVIYGMYNLVMPSTQISEGYTGIQDDRCMTRLEPLSSVFFDMLKNCKTHYYEIRVAMDYTDQPDGYVPRMESNEDKPTIVISEERYNINGYKRSTGTSAYKNAIYAVAGTDTNSAIVQLVKRPGDTARGAARKEAVVNIDVDSVSDISKYALKEAADYIAGDSFEFQPLFADNEESPQLAQKVAVKIGDEVWETIVTEITDEYTESGHKVTYTTGDKELKVINALSSAIAANTSKIINNKIAVSNSAGVGKFANAEKNSEIFNDYSGNSSTGPYNRVAGQDNSVVGTQNSAEGVANTIDAGTADHVEGASNKVQQGAQYSHAEGISNTVSGGQANHVLGISNSINGGYGNHTEGNGNKINNGSYCHVDGQSHTVSGISNHVSGYGSTVDGEFNSAVGQGHNVSGVDNLASGYTNTVQGRYNHAEGMCNKLNGSSSHVGGQLNEVTGNYLTVSGQFNTVGGDASDVSGYYNTVCGSYNLIGGGLNELVDGSQCNIGAGWINKFENGTLQNSMFFGENNSVSGNARNDLIGGEYNMLSGNGSTVSGRDNTVSGNYTIVHGHYNNVTDTDQSAVIGAFNTVSGVRNNATVTGWYNTLSDSSCGSFVTGEFNTVSGENVTVAGLYNNVSNKHNTVFGKFNIDKDLALCIGNGTGIGETPRSNALELDWEGNLHISGKLIADSGEIIGGSSAEISDVIDDNSTNDTAAGAAAVREYVKQQVADITVPALPATLYAVSDKTRNSAPGKRTRILQLHFNAVSDYVFVLAVTASYILTAASGTTTFTVECDGNVIRQLSQVSPAGENFKSFTIPIIGTVAGAHEISVYISDNTRVVTVTESSAVLTRNELSEAEDDDPTEDNGNEPDKFAANFKAEHAPFKAELNVGRQTPLKVNVSEKMPLQKAEIKAKMKGDKNA